MKERKKNAQNIRLSPSLRKFIPRGPCVRSLFTLRPHHVSRLCIVNMAGSVEARFDAAVNVVRSMPKKGINQSFHTKFFKKERCFVFLSVVFFVTCVFSVEILRSLPTFVRHDVKGMSRRQSFTYCRIQQLIYKAYCPLISIDE